MDNDQINKRNSELQRKRIKVDFLIHDLKVPLAVVEAGITSLLRRAEKYGPLTEKQEKVLLRTLRNTKTAQVLINDTLELGKSREGVVNLKEFKLSKLIEQTLVEIFDLADSSICEDIKCCTDFPQLKKALQEKGLLLLIDEEIWFEEICLDEVKIKQILRNLLNNALKYRESQVELVVDREGDWLVFSVKDDGEGIPSAYHKKIFESYFQMDVTDPHSIRGHGLGLAGVMVLVEDMCGKLILESKEGRGAKFLVKVPLTINPPTVS